MIRILPKGVGVTRLHIEKWRSRILREVKMVTVTPRLFEPTLKRGVLKPHLYFRRSEWICFLWPLPDGLIHAARASTPAEAYLRFRDTWNNEYVEGSDLCSKCKGACCKQMPGVAYPEDFAQRDLVTALKSGRWALDYWDGDPRDGKDELDRAYFIRPAIKRYEGRLVHPSWGGECTFLKSDGCELSFDERPWECRHLIPDVDFACQLDESGGKQEAAIEWIPYNLGVLLEELS